MSLFPLATFEAISDVDADLLYTAWGHYLGPCDRPFGRQDFGLFVGGQIVSAATSASTVSATCDAFSRFEVVELARIASKPSERWATRVSLRLWRELAPAEWTRKYREHWPVVRACVSYSNETRHKGDIYRFDGWRRAGVMRGSTGGGTYTSKQQREDKALWIFDIRETVALEATA